MAQLGRDAVAAVVSVKDMSYGINHYVNKTKRYVSIKLETKHLSDAQLERVGNILKDQHPTRFLAVYNNIAHPSSRGMSWTADKINVRFTQ